MGRVLNGADRFARKAGGERVAPPPAATDEEITQACVDLVSGEKSMEPTRWYTAFETAKVQGLVVGDYVNGHTLTDAGAARIGAVMMTEAEAAAFLREHARQARAEADAFEAEAALLEQCTHLHVAPTEGDTAAWAARAKAHHDRMQELRQMVEREGRLCQAAQDLALRGAPAPTGGA